MVCSAVTIGKGLVLFLQELSQRLALAANP